MKVRSSPKDGRAPRIDVDHAAVLETVDGLSETRLFLSK